MNADEADRFTNKLFLSSMETEQMAAVQGNHPPLSAADLCARINGLLKTTPIKLVIRHVKDIIGPARIVRLMPDFEHEGYFVAYCETQFQGYLNIALKATGRIDFYFV